MFSGIIEEKAALKGISKAGNGCRLTVRSEVASKDARIGDSISVDGSCLTVVSVRGKELAFDVMDETLRRTSLSEASPGKAVNLERALRAGDRISGHFVTGHVDCVGRVSAVAGKRSEYALDIEFPEDKAPYLAEKGSIALDGVSLTVGEIHKNRLRVYLIPLTMKETTLGSKKEGDPVNIEFDLLGKYAVKDGRTPAEKSKVDMDFLKEHGFA